MKIPKYYCPNCKRFKRRIQIRTSEYAIVYWCAACGEEIEEVDQWLYEQARQHFKIRKTPQGCESCKYRKEEGENKE